MLRGSVLAAVSAAALLTSCSQMAGNRAAVSDVLTGEMQSAMTPQAVFADLKAGNARFVAGQLTPRDYLAQAASTASGQYPKAVILGCIDSRVPPEIIFDQGIGDVFVGRVAGNFENSDLLGSFEFATKLANSKLIVVLGHSACGAVKGAVAGAEMGNLTGMLDNFDGAMSAAKRRIEAGASTDAMVAATIEENVRITMTDLVERSPVMAELVASGDLDIVGGVYDLETGRVNWLGQ